MYLLYLYSNIHFGNSIKNTVTKSVVSMPVIFAYLHSCKIRICGLRNSFKRTLIYAIRTSHSPYSFGMNFPDIVLRISGDHLTCLHSCPSDMIFRNIILTPQVWFQVLWFHRKETIFFTVLLINLPFAMQIPMLLSAYRADSGGKYLPEM
jgi:hypothetical protein